MGLDVAVVSFCCLPRPGGATYGFVKRLSEDASVECFGCGNAYGSFHKDDVLSLVDAFCKENDCSGEEKKEIFAWVESLPWEDGVIVLNFNW